MKDTLKLITLMFAFPLGLFIYVLFCGYAHDIAVLLISFLLMLLVIKL